MAKRPRPLEIDEDDVPPPPACSALDHVFPQFVRGTKCLCGKKIYGEIRPFIEPDRRLQVFDIFQITLGGPLYQVIDVTESRAYCLPVRNVRDAMRVKPEIRNVNPEVEEMVRSSGSINISPRSCVILVPAADVEAKLKQQGKSEDEVMAQAVALPGTKAGKTAGVKPGKAAEAARRASVADKKAAAKASRGPVTLTGAAKRAKDQAATRAPRPPKSVRPCTCGCGGETTAYFLPGHDARFKAWMVKVERGDMEVGALPKAVQKAFKFVKRGPGFVTTHDYKGEKHSGYDPKG